MTHSRTMGGNNAEVQDKHAVGSAPGVAGDGHGERPMDTKADIQKAADQYMAA